MSLLLRSLEQHARSRPERLAIRGVDADGVRELGWRELRNAAYALAHELRGLERHVVLVVLPNAPELAIALLGGLCAGAWVLPASPDLPLDALAALVERTKPHAVIAPNNVLARLADVPLRIAAETLASRTGGADASATSSASGAVLLQTSGTTGAPKLIRRDLAALDAVGEACMPRIGMTADDLMLVPVALYHSYGLDQAILSGVVAGCALELHRKFSPLATRAALTQRGVTIWPAVPVMLDAMAHLGPERAHRLRRVYIAGSPLPPRIANAFEAAYGVAVGQIYGASEFGSVTFNDPADSDFDAGSAGRPLAGVRARIFSTDFRPERELDIGAEGQIAIAGPSLLSEYVGDPQPAAPGGFVRTGDLGRLDAHGRLYVTGRLRLLIDVGGFKVNPMEVEAVLMRHADVREAVVVALPFSDTVSRLKAVVLPQPGRTLDRRELRAFARRHLIPYQVPRVFDIRSDVPRSATGKILRSELAREAQR
jgi:acyl-CoA synthetase (AMP-forming)/AMP-acid ligase II